MTGTLSIDSRLSAMKPKPLYVERAQPSISVDVILEEIEALEASLHRRPPGEAIRMLTPLLSFIERYSTVVDTMTQYQANPSSLIWGALKLIVLMARTPNSWWNKLLMMLKKLGTQLMIFREYEQIFGESEALKGALASTYMDIFMFLRAAKQEVGQRNTLQTILHWSASSFVGDFEETSSKLNMRLQSLGSLTTLLHRRALHEDLKLQKDFRVEASQALERISASLPPSRINHVENQELAKCISWFSPVDVSLTYHRNLIKRAEGTCGWLTGAKFFQSWFKPKLQEDVARTRWIYGNPGVGKSVLCASVIRHIENCLGGREEDLSIAYFFFDHSNQESLTILALYRTLLGQLLYHTPSFIEYIKPIMDSALKYGRNRISWQDNPSELLKQIIRKSARETLLIIDGLDECENLSQDLQGFLEILRVSNSCRTLFFSRSNPNLHEFSQSFPSMRISSTSTKLDINTYLVNAVSKLPNLTLSTCREVIAALNHQCQGIFLLATIMVKELENATCLEDVEEVLQGQPKELHLLYDSIAQRITRQSPQWTKLRQNIWTLLCCSPRPLLWSELQEGLAMLNSGRVPSKQDLARRVVYKSVVLKACPPLIEYERETDTFRIAHSSMYEYLTSNKKPTRDYKPRVDLGVGHYKIAGICLKYLVMPGVCEQLELDQMSFPYTSYATSHWCYHLLNSKVDHELQAKAIALISSPEHRRLSLATWLALDKSGFPLQSMLKSIRSAQRLIQSLERTRHLKIDELEDILEVLLILDSHTSDSGMGHRITNFERNILLRELAREYSIADRLEEGVEKFKAVIGRVKEEQDMKPEILSWVMSGLGLLYDQQGDVTLAISTQLEALESQKDADANSGVDEVLIVNELGRLYRHDGDLENAELMHLRALESLRSALPETDPQVIWTLNTLARCHRRQGRLEDAIRLHSQSREAQSRTLGDEHPHTLWTQSDLAKCFRDLGQLERAIDLQAKTTKTREKVLGPLHNDTLWSLNDLALMYELSGCFQTALKIHEQALDGQRRTLGDTSPTTLWSEEVVRKLECKVRSDVGGEC
ncbi:hypothetical protein F5Y00DRAFT_270426 [Daldinia vernicosa]|uniref:uncharacterized protein n=1 Tax=Daldinia vernicosa TaxID=114800 RepID=UPI002007F1CD|nr:uncharacterized protein F5Y00DRAFT_270426 [Daldinia vernicosa]KAI0847978.1 hypothetical protein F5Y00DRAFT_270426 [Daldinia vernicosa]